MQAFLRAMAILVLCTLAACEVAPKRAGNTIDLLNDLTAAYPNGANVNVSYRFQFMREIERAGSGEAMDHIYVFEEVNPAAPHRRLQVHIVSPSETYMPEDAERIRLGRRSYFSETFCFHDGNGGWPPFMQPFADDLADFEPGADLLARLFVPEQPEPDGREIRVVFVQELASTGLSCKAIGDPARPTEMTAEMVEDIRRYARRSFEILG